MLNFSPIFFDFDFPTPLTTNLGRAMNPCNPAKPATSHQPDNIIVKYPKMANSSRLKPLGFPSLGLVMHCCVTSLVDIPIPIIYAALV